MREDLKLKDYAKNLGFNPVMHVIDKDAMADHPDRVPNFPYQFHKTKSVKPYKQTVIWEAYDSSRWICADITDSLTYANHRDYGDLKTALDKEQ